MEYSTVIIEWLGRNWFPLLWSTICLYWANVWRCQVKNKKKEIKLLRKKCHELLGKWEDSLTVLERFRKVSKNWHQAYMKLKIIKLIETKMKMGHDAVTAAILVQTDLNITDDKGNWVIEVEEGPDGIDNINFRLIEVEKGPDGPGFDNQLNIRTEDNEDENNDNTGDNMDNINN
jgi:hypothetical protein